MAPSSGEASPSIMKGVFIAGIIVAFAITVVDSLNCAQCHTYNSTCEANATACEEGSLSCVESSVNSTLGGFLHLYQNKFCSASNCSENSTEVAFTVRVFDNQRYRFASQCCQGKECTGTHYGLYRAPQPVLGHTSTIHPCFSCLLCLAEGGCLKSRNFCAQLDNASI